VFSRKLAGKIQENHEKYVTTVKAWQTYEPCTTQIRKRNVMLGAAGWVGTCVLITYLFVCLHSHTQSHFHLYFLLTFQHSFQSPPSHYKRLTLNPKNLIKLPLFFRGSVTNVTTQCRLPYFCSCYNKTKPGAFLL
jgi:hypothetical protein